MSQNDALAVEGFPDERMRPLIHSGDVDCLVCGHRVNVMAGFSIEHRWGPRVWVHGACLQAYGPESIWKLYERTVWSAAINVHPAPTEALKECLKQTP